MFEDKVLACLGVPKAQTDATEPSTIIKFSIESTAKVLPSVLLGGLDTTHQAEVSMWLSFAITNLHNPIQPSLDTLTNLNAVLLSKSYFVGNKYTVADAAIYIYLIGTHSEEIIKFNNISRWFDNIQHVFRKFDKNLELKYFPKKINLISCFQTNTSAVTSIISAAPDKEDNVIVAKAKSESIEDKKVKTSKLPPPPSSESTTAPVVVAVEQSDTSKLDPSKLDIRCGKVVKCWNHPESDKLLCEEVDVGDGAGVIRNIASGIRAHYTAEEFQGKMVVVLCNLKERAIAGFKSQVDQL
jgi:tRNA-binding EMAP/Myf-like protein